MLKQTFKGLEKQLNLHTAIFMTFANFFILKNPHFRLWIPGVETANVSSDATKQLRLGGSAGRGISIFFLFFDIQKGTGGQRPSRWTRS